MSPVKDEHGNPLPTAPPPKVQLAMPEMKWDTPQIEMTAEKLNANFSYIYTTMRMAIEHVASHVDANHHNIATSGLRSRSCRRTWPTRRPSWSSATSSGPSP